MPEDIGNFLSQLASTNRRPMTTQLRIILETWTREHPKEVNQALKKLAKSHRETSLPSKNKVYGKG